MQEKQEKRVYKANYMLQQKVGAGPLDEGKVRDSQKVIDENDVDFTPLGMQYLNQLKAAIDKSKDTSLDMRERKQMMTQPVMELKANATIFHYTLIGNLANIMLSFLEAIDELDDDAISIVAAHHTTLNAIVMKKMSGDGGEYGGVLINELKDACARYYSKKKKKAQAKK